MTAEIFVPFGFLSDFSRKWYIAMKFLLSLKPTTGSRNKVTGKIFLPKIAYNASFLPLTGKCALSDPLKSIFAFTVEHIFLAFRDKPFSLCYILCGDVLCDLNRLKNYVRILNIWFILLSKLNLRLKPLRTTLTPIRNFGI